MPIGQALPMLVKAKAPISLAMPSGYIKGLCQKTCSITATFSLTSKGLESSKGTKGLKGKMAMNKELMKV